jgi:hypothetical protein
MPRMPQIYVETDEWYPVFSYDMDPTYSRSRAHEITADELSRLERAFAEFDWAQGFLRVLDRG